MNKTLRQALPNIRTGSAVTEHMDEIIVTRMTMPRDRSMLKVYLESPVLIGKRDIFALEAAIKQAYFAGHDIIVRVIESFHLENMSPEEISLAYRDSILLELKTFHLLDYNLFRRSELSFPEEGVALLTVPDNMVFSAKAVNLLKYLETLFRDRFGVPLSVRVSIDTSASAKKSEAFFDSEIDEIVKRYRDALEETEERQKAELTQKTKRSDKKYAVKRRFEAGDGIGYQFEDEPIALSEITEEMGEVAVQGQIVSIEPRELKTGNLLYIFVLTDKTDSIKVKLFLKPEEREAIAAVLDYDGLASSYDPLISDPVKNRWRGEREAKSAYLKTWARMALEYPDTYTAAFIAHSSGYYCFTPDYTEAQRYGPGSHANVGMTYFHWVVDDRYDRDFTCRYIDRLAGLRDLLADWADLWHRIPVLNFTDSKPLYTWTALLLGWLLWKRRAWDKLIPIFAVLLMVATCMASPVNDCFRYFAPVAAATPALSILLRPEYGGARSPQEESTKGENAHG